MGYLLPYHLLYEVPPLEVWSVSLCTSMMAGAVWSSDMMLSPMAGRPLCLVRTKRSTVSPTMAPCVDRSGLESCGLQRLRLL